MYKNSTLYSMKAFKTYLGVILLCASGLNLAAQGQGAVPRAQSSWFDEMLQSSFTASGSRWGKESRDVWDRLRARYSSHEAQLQMSWEQRDLIWLTSIAPNEYDVLAGRYRRAYLVSCKERGVAPASFDTAVSSLSDLQRLRDIYLQSRKAEYVILTPKATRVPVINGPAVYGIRPGNELIYRLAVTGERPMSFSVKGLPTGCTLNSKTGVITGRITKPGNYTVALTAQNKYGKASKELVIKVGPQIALTPPLGWNSWNSFACDVTATDIRNTADQLVRSGLANYGWSYINIDDCWMKAPAMENLSDSEKAIRTAYYNLRKPQRLNAKKIRFNEPEVTGQTRNANGELLSNKDFPDMKELTRYIHSYGLKAGIYISPGPLTCQCYEGSYAHERLDAQTFAAWGFDYLKYDWCGYGNISKGETLAEAMAPYQLMGKALREVDRDIIYSLCQYGRKDVWKWGSEVGGNSWRTTGDIRDNWESISRIGFSQAGLEPFAGPGHWNDPDMLVVGYVGWSKNLRPTFLSPNEQYTHITLWSMLSAPLLIGCDLNRLDDFTYGLLSNAEVIAVNQDPLGKQASRVLQDGNVQVWTKPLVDGSVAVAVFNLGGDPVQYQLALRMLNLEGKCTVRDLWRQQSATAGDSVPLTINRHGVKLFKISTLNK